MLKSHFEVSELPGERISIEIPGLFSIPRLYVGNEKLIRKSKLEYLYIDPDGEQLVFKLESRMLDAFPYVIVNDRKVKVAEPLRFFELTWCLFPIGLLGIGGAIGGAVGVVGTYLNLLLFRAVKSDFLKYGFTFIVSLLAYSIWLVLGVLIQGPPR